MIFPYSQQTIDESDIAEVTKALTSDLITRGPYVEAFEKAIANYVGAQYAVACTSGSIALTLAFEALKVEASDKILTTPNTFIATAASALKKGTACSFVDIDRNSGNVDLNLLETNLTYHSTRGRLILIPVHFAGIAMDMEKVDQMHKGYNTFIIEDAAHALGSHYPSGGKVGSCEFSDMTIFSFHPVKNITTGEGGMITTNNPELYERLLLLRNSGMVKKPGSLWSYEIQELSNNYNFTEIQAALGLSQLKRLPTFITKKRKLVESYRKHFKGFNGVRLFDSSYDPITAYHLMVIQIDFAKFGYTRTTFMEALKAKGIGSQYHYIPLYRHPVLIKMMGSIEEYFPEMEAYYNQALSIPLYPHLTQENVEMIANTIKNLLGTERIIHRPR